jgi:hypothetical protein
MTGVISPTLREQVAARSRNACAYCQTQERLIGSSLTIDHIVPRVLGGTTESDNLCLACWECNMTKGVRTKGTDPLSNETVPLFHPNREKWGEHFHWSEDGLHIIGATPTGRATVQLLRLNRKKLVAARRFWLEIGHHPPPDQTTKRLND